MSAQLEKAETDLLYKAQYLQKHKAEKKCFLYFSFTKPNH